MWKHAIFDAQSIAAMCVQMNVREGGTEEGPQARHLGCLLLPCLPFLNMLITDAGGPGFIAAVGEFLQASKQMREVKGRPHHGNIITTIKERRKDLEELCCHLVISIQDANHFIGWYPPAC